MTRRPKCTSGRLIRALLLALVGIGNLSSLRSAMADEPASVSRFTPEERAYWAFQPIVRPAVPDVDSPRVQTAIDAFLWERLQKAGLEFSPDAERFELIRRAKFDLLGLPPTPDEVAGFVADAAPDAYERLLDRLLDSPHYGERWGRQWLDLVRFAETAGYNADPVRPRAYKYRDYVIGAFNRDVPYDRFVLEQLAGDELFPDHPDALIATGFNRLWPDESNASNILLARQDMLNDMTATVGSVFLGLSLGCAQCHDHKFDPLPQKDFYRLQAFFAGLIPEEKLAVGTPEELAAYRGELDEWLQRTESPRMELHNLERAACAQASQDKRQKFPPIVLAALDTPAEKRTALQHQLVFWSERQIGTTEKQMLEKMNDQEKQRRNDLKSQLAALKREQPQPPRPLEAMVALDGSAIPPTHLLAGGGYNKPLEEVRPGFLSILAPNPNQPADAELVPPRPGTSGRRTALARWIIDPQNPLPARVLANRLWQGHFGKGLVENANDLGVQGEPPTHPELLDWLAAELVHPTVAAPRDSANPIPWSLKRMHRLIMLSAAYRQANDRRFDSDLAANAPDAVPPGIAKDSANKLYWHYPRRRLEAEGIRDSLLAVSGLLNPALHGPGVQPPLPPGYTSREAWQVSTSPADQNRRSIYILAKRNLPYPLLQAFDLPDMHETCARRQTTTIAPQALMLLNSELVIGYAQAFSGRLLLGNPHPELPQFIREAYRLAFGREPADEEIEAAVDFIRKQQTVIAARGTAPGATVLPKPLPKFLDPDLAAALTDFCHALVNANEFIYVD